MFLFPAWVQLCFCKDCKRYIVCLEFTMLLHFSNFKVDFIKCCWPSLSMKTLSLCGAKWHTDTHVHNWVLWVTNEFAKCITTGIAYLFDFTLPHSHCFVWPLIMLSVALWYILMIHFDTFTSSSVQKNKNKPPKVNPLNTFILSVLSDFFYIHHVVLCGKAEIYQDIHFFYKMLESKKKLHLLIRKSWGLDRLNKS